jgi:ABC-type amino acid transport substrate-binding protein
VKRNLKWQQLVALLLLLALTLAACGGGEDGAPAGDSGGQPEQFPSGSTMAELQDKGEIVIGVKYDVPPFGFKNPQTGKVEGFDVDLGKIIADKLGVKPTYTEAISDNRIPFLQDGTVDLILSTMTITTDRAVEIDYSRPYFVAHGRILVPQGSDIKNVEGLNGNKVCTGLGSTYESTIEEQAPQADLKLVESYSECFELVKNGAVDAVSTDDVILTGMKIQDPTLQIVGEELTIEPYGAAVADGDREFAEFLSQVIEESFQNGQWDDLYNKWVGKYTKLEPDHPQQYTLEEVYKLAVAKCSEFCKQAKKERDIQDPLDV